MNSSASLTASSVIFNTGSENFGVITAANVTFNDGSANSGAVIGNARFNGSAIHRVGAVVTGDASFSVQATNSGTVTGTVTVDGSGGGTAPVFTADLPSGLQTYSDGQTVTLSVVVEGATSYQWRHADFAGSPYPLQDVPELGCVGSFTNEFTFVVGSPIGHYLRCEATNAYGTTSSAELSWVS